MVDVHNKETRSYNMSRTKGKNTGPEIIVRFIKDLETLNKDQLLII